MVATDTYGKSSYGSGYAKSRESMTFLPFLFSFLIINIYSFSYTFTFHHCSAIYWDFILRLIRLDMCIIFLSVSVIILFVYDSDWYETAATSEKELFMITTLFQSLLSVIEGFVWYVLAAPYPPLFLYFFVLNILRHFE